ncbi:MAG: hypothetical protein ACRENK_08280 [Gemmatimonadaceae bacterium]
MSKRKPPERSVRRELLLYREQARRRVDNPTPQELEEIAEGGRELLAAMEEAEREALRKKLH